MLLGQFQSQFSALFRLPIEGLSHRCRAAQLTQKQNLNLKVASLGSNLQEIAYPDFAGGFGRLLVALNPAEFTGSRSQATRLEKSGSPEPFVNSNTGHNHQTDEAIIASIEAENARAN